MKCSFCGTEVDEKQRFCPNCGLLLDLSFTPYSVKDIEKTQEKTDEPEFLRQKREYQEELDRENSDSDILSELEKEEDGEKRIETKDIDELESEKSTAFEEKTEVSEEIVEIETIKESKIIDDVEEIGKKEESKDLKEIEETEEKEKAEEKEEVEEVVDVDAKEDSEEIEETEDKEDSEEIEETEDKEVAEEKEETKEKEKAEEIEEVEEIEEAEEKEKAEEIEETEEVEEIEESDVFEEGNSKEVEVKEEEEAVKEAVEEPEHEETAEELEQTEHEENEALIYDFQSLEKEFEAFAEETESFEEEEIEDAEYAEEDFFGEIPNDPDDFHEKAMVPPESLKELKAKKPNKKIILATVAAAVLGLSGINYLNSASVRYDSLLKKGDNLIKKEQYSEAILSLENEKGSFKLDERYYLLLSQALSKDGRHDDAVSCLEEAAKIFPNSDTVKIALGELNPKVSSNIKEEIYHDHFELILESHFGKIIYSLSGGKEDIEQAEYTAAIPIGRNGKYTLMAYALASDGAKGELYTKEFTVDLDKEKYHLSSFVDTDEGKSYIDEYGDKAIGWTLIEDSYYYFNEKGIMQTGFLDLNGERYYLNSDGKMHTGRLDLGEKSYYFDEDGHMVRDAWIENRYYLDENGEMLKNQKNSEGIYFNENGDRSFDAEALYKEHPNSILAIVSKERKTEGNNYIFNAEVYYEKKNGRPSGDPAYSTEIVISKSALMSYLDEDLPSITAKDAVSFLPKLYLQNIVQNKDGVVTKFSFVLGERRH